MLPPYRRRARSQRQWLSKHVHPHSNIIKIATVFTIAAFQLINLPVCIQICNNRSTQGFLPHPSLSNLVINVVMMKYAAIICQPILYYANLMGAALNIIYLMLFNCFAIDPFVEVQLPFSVAFVFLVLIIGYSYFEQEENLPSRFGALVVIIYAIYLAAPLLLVDKDSLPLSVSYVSVPVNMIGFFMSLSLLAYGALISNTYLQIAHMLGVLVFGSQVVATFLIDGLMLFEDDCEES